MILNPHLIKLLRHHILKPIRRLRDRNGLTPNQRLFTFTGSYFRSQLHRACARLGLSGSYVPHSLRHGGATKLFIHKWPIADIKHRGRWKEFETCEHYVQDGQAAIGDIAAPRRVRTLGERVSKDMFHKVSKAITASAASTTSRRARE